MSSERQLLSGETDPHLHSAILADPRQRQILALLREPSGPISEDALASQLAAREAKESPATVTEHAHQRIQIDLFHRCVPGLEAAGWIEQRPAGIGLAEQLPVEGMNIWLSRIDDPAVPWKTLAALLAHPRRQQIVSIIAEHPPPLSLDDLGAALRDSDQSRTTDDADDEAALLTTLHHIALPILEGVGLIEYDSAEKTITQNQSFGLLLDQMEIANTTNNATATTSEADF